MNGRAIAKLRQLLGIARAAEAARLAGIARKIAGYRALATRMRGEAGAETPRPETAAELAAASRWRGELRRRAAEADEKAAELDVEAAAQRAILSRAFGREAAAGSMAEQALAAEQRLSARRAEAAVIAPPRNSA